MNIVTPIPTTLVFNTANVNTESARRDNVLRETIPQSAESQQGAAEQGLGSESDQVRRSVKQPTQLTYERPTPNNGQAIQSSDQGLEKDNASDESAGKQDAEQEQQQQAQQREITQLEQRDAEVRAHEQAHASVGGQYASSPNFTYTSGPDGNRYATDGEVSIDISSEQTPEQTIRKMQQVRAAALAPAEPSPQDLEVANEAAQIAFEARNTLAEQKRAEQASDKPNVVASDLYAQIIPTLDEIVANQSVDTPTRTLDRQVDLEAQDRGDANVARRSLDIDDDPTMNKRRSVIAQFYNDVSAPRTGGFAASA